VLDLPPELIEPPPRIGSRLKSEFLKGMGKHGERFLMILEIDRIFSAEEQSAVRELEGALAKA
jgi:purine-binding chemotaxis protein CheW